MSNCSVRLAVVVPTRNRWSLATRAVASTLAQIAPGVTVLVSDNSTRLDERQGLEGDCLRFEAPCVTYLRPPAPLSMTRHWEWAADQAIKVLQPTHLFFLTDRTMFKKRRLKQILDLVANSPDDVLSFRGDDFVADAGRPVRLVLQSCSDQVARLESAEMLNEAARMRFTAALPKMLNSVVPVHVFDDMRQRFGSVFDSVSPDFCFAFRCMAVVESIRFLDSAPIIRYALDRSNGHAWSTAQHSADSVDFLKEHGGAISLSDTPLPAVITLHNSVVHEYCRAARESGSTRFPAIDRKAYAGVIWRDVLGLPNNVEVERSQGLMREAGLDLPVPLVNTPSRHLGRVCRSPRQPLDRRRLWRVARRHTQWLWPRLARVGIRPATTEGFRFPGSEDALRFAERCPVRGTRRFSWWQV
jgi:hypothetical protein